VSMSSSCFMEQLRQLHSGKRADLAEFLPAGAASPALTQVCQTGQGTQRVVGFFPLFGHADKLRLSHGHRIASHTCEVTDFIRLNERSVVAMFSDAKHLASI